MNIARALLPTLCLLCAAPAALAAGPPASAAFAMQPACPAIRDGRAEFERPYEADCAEVYRLWLGLAPGATHDVPAETPTLTVYRPFGRTGNGTAVVIAPGGGYTGLAMSLEGREPASWFANHGVTAFVLTYRVGATARLPIPLRDGARAIRWVRTHAADFGVDPGRIGMMGFSAGGHLAASVAVDADAGVAGAPDAVERASSRPDFLVLGYPWLEGTQLSKGHSQYCDFAIGAGQPACKAEDYARYKPLDGVSSSAPPTFIYHTTSDGLVPVAGSLRFYQALVDHGVPAEIHAFASGPHGTGLGGSDPALSTWPLLLQEWLRGRGLLPVPAQR